MPVSARDGDGVESARHHLYERQDGAGDVSHLSWTASSAGR
jgi:hypothetical protein